MKMLFQKITKQWNKLTAKQRKIFFVLLLILIFVAGFMSKRSRKVAEQSSISEESIPVVVAGITERNFERFIAIQGNLESKNFSTVSPRIAGTIEQIYVDEGDPVVEGKSKLFKTDSIKLQEAVEIQKHLLAVEECVRQQAIANLEKTEADFYKAELDYYRFERLLKKKAVSTDAFEQQQSRYKQLSAMIKLVKANVNLATANVRRAEADLAISQKDLADTVIYAPITGKISHRFKEPGEMGQPGEPVVRIDDISLIEASVYLPAQYYTEVISDKTLVDIFVSGKNIGQFPVDYKSPTINPKLRTFEVKCLLDNLSETITAGAMAQIRIILEKRRGWAVPLSSIQQRENKSVIFTVSKDKAHKTVVRTGIENNGWIEVISGDLNEQDLIVTMGQNMLKDGKIVSIQKEGN